MQALSGCALLFAFSDYRRQYPPIVLHGLTDFNGKIPVKEGLRPQYHSKSSHQSTQSRGQFCTTMENSWTTESPHKQKVLHFCHLRVPVV